MGKDTRVRQVNDHLAGQGGFTLIELMIVLTILSVLLALAMPSFQDYTVRAKVSEGLSLMGPAKLAIEETCQVDASSDITTSSGFSFSSSEYVSAIRIFGNCSNAIIVAWTQNTGADWDPVVVLIKASSIQFIEQLGDVGIDPGTNPSWGCVFGAPSPGHAPSKCRFNPEIT